MENSKDRLQAHSTKLKPRKRAKRKLVQIELPFTEFTETKAPAIGAESVQVLRSAAWLCSRCGADGIADTCAFCGGAMHAVPAPEDEQ